VVKIKGAYLFWVKGLLNDVESAIIAGRAYV